MDWVNFAILLLSLGVILLGAELFTNGVEWLGKKLCLSEGAVGSVLAAVGTALPESIIPIIAILFGAGANAHEVGVGAILGAPFMLGTLAFFVTGVAALYCNANSCRIKGMAIDFHVLQRDLKFFIIMYFIAIIAAFIRVDMVRYILAILLLTSYGFYVYRTFTSGKSSGSHLNPLYCARKSEDPHLGIIIFQIIIALTAIVLGAKFFVGGVEELAGVLGINPLILSLIITPIATELPEKFNSVIWIRQGKDTLALGNISGAMVFQSSVIPVIGITLTPWALTLPALVSALMALISATVILITTMLTKKLSPWMLFSGGFYYALFIGFVVFTQLK